MILRGDIWFLFDIFFRFFFYFIQFKDGFLLNRQSDEEFLTFLDGNLQNSMLGKLL